MFLNFSNHPCSKWGDKQINASLKYGKVVDLPFPSVPADSSEDDIQILADEYCNKICEKVSPGDGAVLVQGEFTLSYAIIYRLLERGIKVVSACSDRNVIEEEENGRIVKKIIFDFGKYREYK